MRPEDLEFVDPPRVPGYRVIGALGSGSRGTVFRARELATQDVIALKVLEPDGEPGVPAAPSGRPTAEPGVPAARDHFARLIAHASRLDSPAVAKPRATAAFTDADGSDRLALVMDCAEGDPLARALQRNVRFAPRRAARIVLDVARALGEARGAGLCAGALHPGRIVLGEPSPGLKSGARLVGLRLARPGTGGGLPTEFEDPAVTGRTSPHVYAANERLLQAGASPPNESADVFSLGAILYHLLTGLPPYKATSLGALKVERADGPVCWPRGATEEIPKRLIDLVDRMTSANPAERPALDSSLFSALASSSRRSRAPAANVRKMPDVRVEPPQDVAPMAPVDRPERARVRADEAAVPGSSVDRALRAGRDVLRRPSATAAFVGGVAVVFLVGVAVALKAGMEETRKPEGSAATAGLDDGKAGPVGRGAPAELAGTAADAGSPGEVDAATPAREASEAAGTPRGRDEDSSEDEVDEVIDDLRAIARILDENPADAEAFRARLGELTEREGEAGVRATRLLARLDGHRRRRADEELKRLIDRAAPLEAVGRYGEALEVLKEFPHERFPGTNASTRARLEVEAIEGRAAHAFARTEKRAADLMAKLDFDAARAEYEAFRRTVGIPEWIERAEGAVAAAGRLEEDTAVAEARERAKAEARKTRAEIESAFAEIARLCARCWYSKAEKLLASTLETLERKLGREPTSAAAGFSAADLRELEAERRRLASYGELVRIEAEQFRLVARRVRSGERQGLCSLRKSALAYAIQEVTERGIVLAGGEGESAELSWSGMSHKQAYRLMLVVGSVETDYKERLAIAVFAHHRGLESYRENELTVAERHATTAGAKALVRRVRETLSGVKPNP